MTKRILACLVFVSCAHTNPGPPPLPTGNPVNTSQGVPLVVNKQVEGDLINCADDNLKQEIGNLIPVALQLIVGGKPDWKAQLTQLEAQGNKTLFCALVAVNADLNQELDAGVTYKVVNPVALKEANQRLSWAMDQLLNKPKPDAGH